MKAHFEGNIAIGFPTQIVYDKASQFTFNTLFIQCSSGRRYTSRFALSSLANVSLVSMLE